MNSSAASVGGGGAFSSSSSLLCPPDFDSSDDELDYGSWMPWAEARRRPAAGGTSPNPPAAAAAATASTTTAIAAGAATTGGGGDIDGAGDGRDSRASSDLTASTDRSSPPAAARSQSPDADRPGSTRKRPRNEVVTVDMTHEIDSSDEESDGELLPQRADQRRDQPLCGGAAEAGSSSSVRDGFSLDYSETVEAGFGVGRAAQHVSSAGSSIRDDGIDSDSDSSSSVAYVGRRRRRRGRGKGRSNTGGSSEVGSSNPGKKKNVSGRRKGSAETTKATRKSAVVPVGEIGYAFRKHFPGHGYFVGRVVKIRPGAEEGKDRRCVYSDGDIEDLSLAELRSYPAVHVQGEMDEGPDNVVEMVDFSSSSSSEEEDGDSDGDDRDGDMQRAMAESQAMIVGDGDDHDGDLQRAMAESQALMISDGGDDRDGDLQLAMIESQASSESEKIVAEEAQIMSAEELEMHMQRALEESRMKDAGRPCTYEEFQDFRLAAEGVWKLSIEEIEAKSLVRGSNTKHMYGRVGFEATQLLFRHLELMEHETFIDLGAGVGYPSIQAALTIGCASRGIEIDRDRHALSEALNKGIEEQVVRWENTNLQKLQRGKIDLRFGDMRDNENRNFIIEADVALVNNAHEIFSSRSVTTGMGHKGHSLDDHIGALFAQMKPSSRLVCLYPLLCLGESLSEANKRRERSNKDPSPNASFFEARTVHLPPKAFTWSASKNAEVPVYIYTRVQNFVEADWGGAYFICGNPQCPCPDAVTSIIDEETKMLRHTCAFCEARRASSGIRNKRKLKD